MQTLHEIGPVVPMHIGRPLEAHILKTMGIRGKAISNKVLGENLRAAILSLKV